MKHTIKAYLSFTRMERIGIFSLCGLILILLAIRITLIYLPKPAINTAEDHRLQAAWEVYKRSQPAEQPIENTTDKSEYTDRGDGTEQPLPNVININTADSATLVRLKGIGPAMTHKIMIYRAEHGSFKNVEELQEIQTIPKATFDILKKHLSVSDTAPK